MFGIFAYGLWSTIPPPTWLIGHDISMVESQYTRDSGFTLQRSRALLNLLPNIISLINSVMELKHLDQFMSTICTGACSFGVVFGNCWASLSHKFTSSYLWSAERSKIMLFARGCNPTRQTRRKYLLTNFSILRYMCTNPTGTDVLRIPGSTTSDTTQVVLHHDLHVSNNEPQGIISRPGTVSDAREDSHE